MDIFWMYTLEGPQIPVLMLRQPLSIDNVNTEGMITHDESHTAPPELVQDWFNATNEDLLRFMDELAIAPTLFKAGRTLTLPATVYLDNMKVAISPKGYTVKKEDTGVENWEGGYSSGDPKPFDGRSTSNRVYFWRESQTMSSIKRNQLSFDINGSYFSYRRYSDGTIPSSTTAHASVVVLIRDMTGRVKPVEFRTYNNNNTPEMLRNKVLVRSTPGSTPGITNQTTDEFWQEQTGGEPEQPKGGGIVDVTNRFSPRMATSALGAYPLNRDQVTQFFFDMWSTSFTEKINYELNGKPMDSIIALRWYFGLLGSIKRLPTDAYVAVGNVPFDGVGVDSTIITKPAASEFLTYSCGEIEIPRHFNNFLDMHPFTQMQVYIPYVGFASLDATEFAGRMIRLDYNINIVTGAAIAYVYVYTGPNQWRISMEIPCSVGLEIPLNVDGKESIASRMATTAAGVGVAALGIAAMAAAPPAAAAAAGGLAGARVAAAGGAAQGVIESQFENVANSIQAPQVHPGTMSRSGGTDSETASLGYMQPFVLITRPVTVAPDDYNEIVGTPDFRSGAVESFNGYMKAGAIAGNGDGGIPRQAMDEIAQMLRAGVYSA